MLQLVLEELCVPGGGIQPLHAKHVLQRAELSPCPDQESAMLKSRTFSVEHFGQFLNHPDCFVLFFHLPRRATVPTSAGEPKEERVDKCFLTTFPPFPQGPPQKSLHLEWKGFSRILKLLPALDILEF